MIMFFQMFKNSMYICCSVRGKIMLLRNNIYKYIITYILRNNI
jgi:hypothetical protein